jgi:hypothetical protein
MVLVHDGDAEDGHHCVADELFDDATVALDHEAYGVEVARHEALQRLGVEPADKLGRLA